MSYSSLIKLSFEELYQRYDDTSDESTKQLIQQVVESKKPPKPDPNFTPYPQHNDPKFQEILFEKKEFNSNQLFLDSTTEDQCNTEFSIKPHQIVLKNFMNKESPYRSLLVYHGVGVGKTCSGLTIAENFRDTYARKDRRILILCSKNIQIGWKKTIYSPDKGINQCTGDSFASSEAESQRQVNKLIKQYYEIMAYQSFSNFVKRKQNEYIKSLPEDEREQGKHQWIQEYFSDRLLIIDEAHNIRDDQGKDMRDAVKTIEDVLKYSNDLRLVLLTATPMYNRSTEIIWMLNMMLLNDKKTLLDYKSVFDKNGGLTEAGKSLLEMKSKGRISYLRGENPITFPLRITPKYLKHKNGNKIFPLYSKKHDNSILLKHKTPSLNLVGGQIKKQDKFKFLELFGSKLSGLQEIVYNQAIQNMIDSTPDLDLDERGEKNSILDNVLLTQITDFVFPIDTDMKDVKKQLHDKTLKVEDFYGANGFKNSLNKKGKTFSYKKKSVPFFDKDFIKDYSCKMSSILEAIDNSDGIVFVYTNFVDSGIVPLQLMLEHNGYKRFDKRKVLSYPDYKKTLGKHACKREPMSYNGLRKSDAGDTFKQATFMVIDGSTNKKELAEQLNIVTSNSNSNGGRIKIILGTVVASEGLDFKRIRSIHILDPWLHLNRIEQTVGRGIRFCSHADLPPSNKNVLTYLHTSTLSDDRETIDTSIYRYAEKKSVQIGLVETILKKNAVDRNLYENVNVIPSNSLNKVIVQPTISQSKEILVDPSDKAYSKVCSYMPECDYNKDLNIDYNVDINKDTFFESYSKNAIQNIKKKISLLFNEFYVFRLESILGLMNEYGFTYDDMIYQALSEMISEKYIIYSKSKMSGYICNRGNYYLFQPFLYEDKYLPIQYRNKPIESSKRVIKLDKINKIIEKPIFSSTYTLDSILNIYNESISEIIDGQFMSLFDVLHEVYSELTLFDVSILSYIYDRLAFSDKCGILYAHLKYPVISDSKYHEEFKTVLDTYLIYVNDKNEYYFGQEHNYYKQLKLFGFYITFQNKPVFYEYYNESIQLCDKIQLSQIYKSLKRYKQSSLGKSYKKHSNLWGYTTKRIKNGYEETLFKFVPPKTKDIKYPPGPGNVCIENNLGSSKEKIKELVDTYLPELTKCLQPYFTKNKKGSNKKHLCCLLELVLRYKPDISFYSLDTIWLKYL
jgi:superfamily II DNA or RNA helicase